MGERGGADRNRAQEPRHGGTPCPPRTGPSRGAGPILRLFWGKEGIIPGSLVDGTATCSEGRYPALIEVPRSDRPSKARHRDHGLLENSKGFGEPVAPPALEINEHSRLSLM
jgi:hypothetical protein